MSRDLRESNAAVNAAVNAKLKLLDGGYLRIYSGERPATADEQIDSKKQALLVELRWGNPAFSGAVDGEAKANSIVQAEATDTGAAAWFRALSKNLDRVLDGSAGPKGGDYNLTLPTVSISAGVTVRLTDFVYRQAKQ